ncbi:MAG TPA: GFA family protein [Steroidobacteraceae bacterium]|nr:GFA family protein [Steroidobacteraceae bacterium]
MSTTPAMSTGGCLCGGVRYAVRGALRDVIACHCSQCRRTSGHHVAASGAPSANITLLKSDTLAWYSSSDRAERGFCSRCGGNLFWRPTTGERAWTSIMAGTLDPPTHLKIRQHIFVADKSDYYTIADGVPQTAGDST